MREDFLHYVWQYRAFAAEALLNGLFTVQNEPLEIVHVGLYSGLSGPDFFNAQLIIGGQKWAGNVEVHLKSSDWYAHAHERDPHYDTVILHVVWEHDIAVYRKDNTEIPVFELKQVVNPDALHNYQRLLEHKTWIYCENQLHQVPQIVVLQWQERLFFERLERKSTEIEQLLGLLNQDWEAVLFCLLAKNFGLNTNGEVFLKVATTIPFSVIRKESVDVNYLEALFFGFSDLLPEKTEDRYSSELRSWFHYLCIKYKLTPGGIPQPLFFRHRPDNFPTIRLAQLAMLYHTKRNLFSELIAAQLPTAIYSILEVGVSDYWRSHYTFRKPGPARSKTLTQSFCDLIIVNTIIPLQFAYYKLMHQNYPEHLPEMASMLKAEKNNITEGFAFFGIKATTAFHSQALLQLKGAYCDAKKCLNCAIGIELLSRN